MHNTFKTDCKVNDIGSHNVLQVILSNFKLLNQNTLTELTLEMGIHLRALANLLAPPLQPLIQNNFPLKKHILYKLKTKWFQQLQLSTSYRFYCSISESKLLFLSRVFYLFGYVHKKCILAFYQDTLHFNF